MEELVTCSQHLFPSGTTLNLEVPQKRKASLWCSKIQKEDSLVSLIRLWHARSAGQTQVSLWAMLSHPSHTVAISGSAMHARLN